MTELTDLIDGFFESRKTCSPNEFKPETKRAYRTDISDFVSSLDAGTTSLSQVKEEDTKQYFRTTKWNLRTKLRKKSALNSFYAYLKDRSIVTDNPFNYLTRNISYKERLQQFVTHEEFDKLIKCNLPLKKGYHTNNTARDRAVLALMYGFGLKKGVIESLRSGSLVKTQDNSKTPDDSISCNSEEFEIYEFKTIKPRFILVRKEFSIIYEAYASTTSDHDVPLIAKEAAEDCLHTRTISRVIEKWSASASVRANPESLRNGYIVDLVNAGINTKLIAEYVGIKYLALQQKCLFLGI